MYTFYLSVEGCLGWFHFLTTKSKAKLTRTQKNLYGVFISVQM